MRNGVMLQGFQWELPADGRHWSLLKKQARQFARMGITSLWLPPATKGSGGANDVGYGVYDLYDLGEFDQKGSVRTKYGTAAEYRACVKALRAAGIQTLADAVLNHRLGADGTERVRAVPVNPDNRLDIGQEAVDAEVYTRFGFPGRGKRYSGFEWNASCFTAVDWNGLDPRRCLWLLEGKQWATDVDGEHGNYDYLMGADVDVNDPRVKRELNRWGRWYLLHTRVDGFRLDAVKHISAAFYRDWLKALRRASRREVYAVGEYWQPDVEALLRYLDQVDHGMDLFDVPLHFHLREASASGGAYDMRQLMQATLTQRAPMCAVTFVDNHDTQPGQSLESWVDGWFKAAAYGIILLQKEGYPCVFWGDLFGIPSRGIGAVSELPELMRIRRWCAWGEQTPAVEDSHLFGFVRGGTSAVPGSGLVFLCTNAGGGVCHVEVGQDFAGQTFRCAVGGQASVRIGEDGWADFAVADGGCSVYVPQETLRVHLWRAWTTARKRLAGAVHGARVKAFG